MAFDKIKKFTKGVAKRLRPLPSNDGTETKKTSRSRSFADKLRTKQRLVVMDAETYREHWSFLLSAQNLFVAIGIVAIVLMVLTFLLVAFTPLHNLIPGYTNGDVIEQTYQNVVKLDSLESNMRSQEEMLSVLSAMVAGEEIPDATAGEDGESRPKVQGTDDKHCKEDSLLRAEITEARMAEANQRSLAGGQQSVVSGQLFFPPIKGKVLTPYNTAEGHLGVDIAGNKNEIIKAAANGTVFFSGFTADDGHVLAIQHTGNIITVYKHNSALLKHNGDVVRAGDPVAYLGQSSTTATPHLHFELWINGKTTDPLTYISF